MGGKNKNHKKRSGGGSGANKSSSNTKSAQNAPVTMENISPEFKTIILDFLRDIDSSFPEYHETLSRYLGYSHEMKPMPDELYIELYSYCRMVYPARFFDILYKNEAIFKSATETETETETDATNTMFLPNVEFSEIWKTEDISENTKDIIWKYLQLILFSIINNLSDMGSFGDTAKLFEAIDENELKGKLEEVIGSMSSFFDSAGAGAGEGSVPSAGEGHPGADGGAGSQENMDETFKKATDFMNTFMPGMAEAAAAANDNGNASDTKPGASSSSSQQTPPPQMPDAGSIHDHLSSILNGKIGKLAKEIAEETASDLNLNMDNATSVSGVFQQLLKNPGKLSGIIKSVGSKLDSKMKSGELKESEIMQEASDLMNKMKNMPGMNNIASMLSKMGMNVPGGMGGGGSKVNLGAMQAQLQKNMKQAQMRERMMKKVQEKQQQQQQPASFQTGSVFRSGEKVEKTPRFPQAAAAASPAAAAAATPAPAPTPAESAAAAAEARMLATESSGSKKQKQKHKQE